MQHTTAEQHPSTARIEELAAQLDCDVEALKAATRLNPKTGELASPAAFCRALGVELGVLKEIISVAASSPDAEPPADFPHARVLTVLRAAGDRRFAVEPDDAPDTAAEADERTARQTFAARVGFDLEALQHVVRSVHDDWAAGAEEEDPGRMPSAVAVCHVADLALVTIIRAADYAAGDPDWDPDKDRELKPC